MKLTRTVQLMAVALFITVAGSAAALLYESTRGADSIIVEASSSTPFKYTTDFSDDHVSTHGSKAYGILRVGEQPQ